MKAVWAGVVACLFNVSNGFCVLPVKRPAKGIAAMFASTPRHGLTRNRRRVSNVAPVGNNSHSDSIELTVPLVLINDGAGARWYHRALTGDQADTFVDLMRESGTPETYRIDLPVVLPPAYLVDEACYRDLDDVRCQPARVQVETLSPGERDRLSQASDTLAGEDSPCQDAIDDDLESTAGGNESPSSASVPGMFSGCGEFHYNVIARPWQVIHLSSCVVAHAAAADLEGDRFDPAEADGVVLYSTACGPEDAERWLAENPHPNHQVVIVSDDVSTWPFTAKRTPDTELERYDEDLEYLLAAASRGRAENASAADRLAFDLVQMLLTSEGVNDIPSRVLFGAEVLVDVFQETPELVMRHVGKVLR